MVLNASGTCTDGTLTYAECWCTDGILMCTDCKCTDGKLTYSDCFRCIEGILKCTVYCVLIV